MATIEKPELWGAAAGPWHKLKQHKPEGDGEHSRYREDMRIGSLALLQALHDALAMRSSAGDV